jgi:hypothetical protein
MPATRKKSTAVRKNGTRKSFLSRATSPVGRVLNAVNKTAGVVVNYTKNILSKSVKGVRKIGGIMVKTTNKAIGNVTKKGTRRNSGSK